MGCGLGDVGSLIEHGSILYSDLSHLILIYVYVLVILKETKPWII